MTAMTDRPLTSPLRKLVQFFRRSRDKWKKKCQDAKASNKLLANQTRAVERSREQWRQRSEEQAKHVKELEAELQKIVAAARGGGGDSAAVAAGIGARPSVPAHGHAAIPAVRVGRRG